MRISFGEIAEILDLPAPVGEGEINGAKVDSRQIAPGDLFVCVAGEKVDGHDYIARAEEAGASAILASRDASSSLPVFIVRDTVEALGKIAARARQKTEARVVCLTGTAGKTTLKDALASIFSVSFKTMATDKNHNNQIGLPLTILNAKGDEDFWILEAGISHEGDMDYLGAIARPDLGVLLNVGPGHTEGLGKKGVAANKAELLKWLARDGVALVSGDYPNLLREARKYVPDPEIFGLREASDGLERAFALVSSRPLDGIYELKLKDDICEAKTPYMGEWGAEIALAAAATARLCGLSTRDIQTGLGRAQKPEQRFRKVSMDSWEIFDDTYNANPLSMSRMIASARDRALEAGSPLVLVLGEMGELGEESENLHKALGEEIKKANPRAVFWKGGRADATRAGINDPRVPFIIAEDPQKFREQWNALGIEGGVALFKGSRSNRMENLLNILKPNPPAR